MRSYYLLRELGKYHDVDVFALNQQKLMESYFRTSEEGVEKAREATASFIQTLHVVSEPYAGKTRRIWCILRSLAGMPYSVRWLYSSAVRNMLKRLVDTGNYDVIHYDTVGLACYLHDHAAPAVLDHHNIESHMMLRRAIKEESWLKKLYFWQEGYRLRRYEKGCVKRFVHHLVCSDDDAKRLDEIDSSLNISVVPNTVPIGPWTRSGKTAPRVLFVGGMNWYPNHDAVVYLLEEVWPLIRRSVPDASLDIVGKAPSDRILQLAAKSPEVSLHGFVDDIEDMYKNARAFVCPIRDGGGTKLKVLDAFSHGVPVVSHSIACEGLDVKNGIHVLMSESAEGIAEAVVRLLNDPELADRLGRGGYALVQREYSIEQVGAKLARIFSEIPAEDRYG